MRSRTVEKCYLIDQPSKRLRRAFRATYFVVSLSNSALLRRRAAEDRVLPVSDLDNDDGRPFSVTLDIFTEVDRKALSVLVPERKMEALAKFGAGGVNSLAAALQTDPKLGISGEDVKRRIELFGSNTYVKPPVRSFFSFVVEAFKDITILILLACAVLSLGFGIKQHGIKEGWYDGGSIIVAVILVVAVSAVSNYRQGTQFHKLSVESEDIKVQVLRDGRRQAISVFEVVVGDVVFLSIGDRVPADGLFLDGYSMKVDESSMNGESDHVAVDSATNPFLLSGTKVADGYGHMIVTSVGMNTSWGEMMSSINRDSNELTPLQERLTKLTSYIGKIGLLVAFVVLAVLLIRYFTGHTEDDQGRREFTKGQTKADDVMNAMIRIVAAAVTIIVVAIPEGLPLAVTLTLAYSMRKMMGDNAMVRKLSACETMGSATTICTDKTGTLTLNQMKVTEAWIGKTALLSTDSCSPEVLQKLQEGIAMNTTGEVFQRKEISGSPTESAILHWAVFDLDADIEELKKRHEMVHVEAFNSKKKRSGVLIRKTGSCRQGNETVEAHWKGAAEMILGMCSNYYDRDGMMMPMTNEDRMQIEGIIDDMAAKSLRCIAFAHKEIGRVTEEIEETGLTLLSIVGIKDPCRPGVREAVMSCKHAGVDVKMITGDNKFTATAIALECGILRASEDLTQAVVEGMVFRNYTNEERMEKVDMIRVMARSSPIDKLLMVECLKRKGHVVAVTGDGTNDAPALKEADIGLSMGIQGTEVAKESSDIVIMDDNFSSVVTVLKWGRCVYNNIQKFIQFQLTVNVAALVINVVAALSSGEVPLTAVQLLWVNLIMDTLGALALATEQPRNDLLQKKPVGRREALITRVMWRNLMAQAVYQITVLLVLEFKGREIFGVGEKVKDTLVFNSFVLCQVFNEFNARSLEKKNIFVGILKNRLFIGIIVVTLVLQALMVEFLKKFASTERLNWGQWGVCILIGSLSWPIAWVVKLIPVSRKRLLLSLPTTTNSNNNTME